MAKPLFITPKWPAPKNVRAFSTCRSGGVSVFPFDSFNIAQHVGDKSEDVEKNRLLLPHNENIVWLRQTHSNRCLDIDQQVLNKMQPQEADASFTRQKLKLSAVMTADCLPVLLCDDGGTVVASVHAGWRGLADGVIENTLNKMAVKPEKLMAWMGPAISQKFFEVGPEVKFAFQSFPQAFIKNETLLQEKYFANLYCIATQLLNQLGVERVYGGDYCTYTDEELFFSHRRTTHIAKSTVIAKPATGRMLSAVYLT